MPYTREGTGNGLDPPVAETRDQVIGASYAPITLVEYGGYGGPHCRAANERISLIIESEAEPGSDVLPHGPSPRAIWALDAMVVDPIKPDRA
jgi:hypothetical protein